MITLFLLGMPAQGATFTLCSSGCDYNGTATEAVNALSFNDMLQITEPGSYAAGGMQPNGNVRVEATVSGVTLTNARISSAVGGMQFRDLAIDCGGSRFVTLSVNDTLVLDRVHITNCAAPAGGGGVAKLTHTNAALTIVNSWVEDNGGSDGGVVYQDNGAVTIQNSLFCRNRADGKGGVLYRSSGANFARLEGNLFVESDATEGGVVQSESGGGLTFDHNTVLFAAATSKGAGLELNQLTATVTNNLFAHTEDQFAMTPDAPFGTYGWNGWWNNTDGNVPTGDLGMNAQTGDPGFPAWTSAPECDPHVSRPGALAYRNGGLLGSEIGFYGSSNFQVYSTWSDDDADGQMAIWDCDDADDSVFLGAVELCDGLDNNCDGLVDNGMFYVDLDGDGYGDPGSLSTICFGGSVLDGTDCDDTDSSIHPGAPETCDGVDEDCDSFIDNGLAFETYYPDVDMDGYGADIDAELSCAPILDVMLGGDCDDLDGTRSPGLPEICDGIDNDCSGQPSPDEFDGDGDGFLACEECDDTNIVRFPGNPEVCDGFDNDCDLMIPPNENDGDNDGARICDLDCDDADSARFPANPEICDGVDNDCDLVVDDGLVAPIYADTDGDGFGAGATTGQDCVLHAGQSFNHDDCDDFDPAVHPGALEVCDDIDNDCAGGIDDGLPQITFYADGDGDGFGVGVVAVSCSNPGNGAVQLSGDCDDADASINPSAIEICDGLDQDCDLEVDEDIPDITFYEDMDLDGYGGAEAGTDCRVPMGNVEDDTDCDDSDSLIFPGAPEICDGEDNDCDQMIDENATAVDWFVDDDLDGFGDPSFPAISDCSIQVGRVTNDGDCDDDDGAIRPTAVEVCDGRDNDCNTFVDDEDPDLEAPLFYIDDDGDGFGSDLAVGVPFCLVPLEFVVSRTDCDDADAGVNPNAVEACIDLIDNDCDGLIDMADTDYIDTASVFYQDADFDGVGNPNEQGFFCSFELPEFWVPPTLGEDCNDQDSLINPNVPEVCDTVDNNCDGTVDEGFVLEAWYEDLDLDGYGSTLVEICPGASTAGYVDTDTDCDDDDITVHPGAQEVCDGLDQNCIDGPDDGLTFELWYPDDDDDGFGDLGDPGVESCGDPPEPSMVLDATDCDDADEDVFPGALEVCDGFDNDCDGVEDPARIDHWPDLDGDGLGDQAASAEATCDPNSDQVPNDDDCDDSRIGDQCAGGGQASSGCKCQGSPGGGAWVLILLAALSRRRIRGSRCA